MTCRERENIKGEDGYKECRGEDKEGEADAM